jgi:adenylate cyclase
LSIAHTTPLSVAANSALTTIGWPSHVGTVHYGNIGAADRLDFTVIGPAVNLVSRIENAAKMLRHHHHHAERVVR